MATAEDQKTFIERVHAEGFAKGFARSVAEDILRLLEVRGLAPTAENRERVATCTDLAQLDLWLVRAVTATTLAEVFAD